MFKKRAPKANARRATEGSDNDDRMDTTAENLTTVVPTLKPKVTGVEKKPIAKLSFDDEIETTAPTSKGRKPRANPLLLSFPEETRVASSAAPTYSAEELAALQKSTFKQPAVAKPKAAPEPADMMDEDIPMASGPQVFNHAQVKKFKEQRERARQLQNGDFMPLEHTGGASGQTQFLDEEAHRIAFGDPRKLDEQQRKATMDAARDAEDDDAAFDPETADWEEQQIHKGVSRLAAQAAIEERAMSSELQTRPLTVTAQTVTVGAVQKRLKEAMNRVRADHEVHLVQLRKTEVDLRSAEEAQQASKRQLVADTERYEFFQDLKQYMLDLVSCLDEKGPMLVSLEQELMVARSEFANMLIDRREEALQAILGAAAHGHAPVVTEDITVTATEDERLAFADKMDNILDSSDTLFDDTLTEFYDIATIRGRFESWLMQFTEEYYKAYITLCLPSVFGPFARRELLRWNIFAEPTLNNMNWCQLLQDYGAGIVQTGKRVAGMEEQSHEQLIPTIIERVVIPHVLAMVENVWDPRTLSETSALQSLLRELSQRLPAGHVVFGKLLDVVVARLGTALDLLAQSISALVANRTVLNSLCEQRALTAAAMFESICAFVTVIPEATVQHAALSRLAEQTLLPLVKTLRVDSQIAVIDKMMSSVPTSWLARGVPRGFHLFAVHLQELSDHLCAKQSGVTPDAARVLLNTLVKLDLADDAANLSSTFHLR